MTKTESYEFPSERTHPLDKNPDRRMTVDPEALGLHTLDADPMNPDYIPNHMLNFHDITRNVVENANAT